MLGYYRNNIDCGANIKELKDESAIKGNLSQKNAFLVAKQDLMGIRPILVSHLGILGAKT